jgi:hypothetical protein
LVRRMANNTGVDALSNPLRASICNPWESMGVATGGATYRRRHGCHLLHLHLLVHGRCERAGSSHVGSSIQ